MSPEPNTHETIEFLIRYRRDEPIVLTAIVPDGGPVESETFRPQSDGERLEAWINERQGKKNLYFTVNPTLKPLSGRVKAKKEHIRGMIALHVDLDPRAGEDLEKERTRALALIKGFKPAPSFVIDSGGGFQGFWVLPKEVPTNGSTEEAAPLEAYNQQIALLLAADPCHNIDRIMRLPGTLNIPDKKKLAKGRKLALARLVEWNDTRHDLSEFTAAPAVQIKSERSGEGVKLSGNLAKADLDALPKQVSSKLKTIIIQGEDADDVNRFPSRSEALFYVCCELIRGGVDDDTIASIIMDRDLGIAASVLDKPRPHEYAARQIQRAQEEVECPELRELNDQFAVIHNYGGRCRVISEACDFAMGGQRRIAAHSFDDFRNMFCNRFVQLGKKTEALGTWWLKHPKRRQYRTVSFCPERPVPPDVYNLWRGFACKAVAGDCTLFLQHLRENICAGNPERYEYVLSWLATVVQHPERPGEVALVLRGKQGTGKSKFAKVFGSLWGSHFVSVSDPKHLTGSFNAHLRDCVVLLADEAFYAGDKKHESILKRIVTEETTMIEAKGYDAEQSRNCTHLIMASNSDWVVPAGLEERRFLVLDVGESQMQNSEFFGALDRELESGGREALLHLLLNRDLSGFNVRRFPQTEALREQKLLSLETHEEEWVQILRDGVTPDADFWKPGPDYVSVQGLAEALEARRALPLNRRGIQTKLGVFLKKYACRGADGRVIERKVRRDVLLLNGRYVLPPPPRNDDDGPHPAIQSMRRTMIKLRPLTALRKECSALSESWPASPASWILAEDESDEEPQEALSLVGGSAWSHDQPGKRRP